MMKNLFKTCVKAFLFGSSGGLRRWWCGFGTQKVFFPIFFALFQFMHKRNFYIYTLTSSRLFLMIKCLKLLNMKSKVYRDVWENAEPFNNFNASSVKWVRKEREREKKKWFPAKLRRHRSHWRELSLPTQIGYIAWISLRLISGSLFRLLGLECCVLNVLRCPLSATFQRIIMMLSRHAIGMVSSVIKYIISPTQWN